MSQHSSESEQITNATDTPPGHSVAMTPGAQIRQAREASGMSMADLAAHTRLARHTLEALERDDFGALLEPVYVRGYYRKVARVLKLDEDLLIASYEKLENPQEPVMPVKLRLASGAELGSGSRLPMAMATLLAVLAVVISGFLWLSRPQPVEVRMQDIANVASGGDIAPPPEVVQSGAAADLPGGGDVTQAETPSPTAQAPVGQDTATGDTSATGTAASVRPQAAGATSDVSSPAVSSDALQLTFREDCWVRIDDANGKTLMNELRRAGQNAVLSGAQPLNVFLGNAPGVTLAYNGQTIDTTPYTRENKTARLRVPLE